MRLSNIASLSLWLCHHIQIYLQILLFIATVEVTVSVNATHKDSSETETHLHSLSVIPDQSLETKS